MITKLPSGRISISREDDIPAFGAYLRPDGPPDEQPLIFLNVDACFDDLEDEHGVPEPMTLDDRKRLLITTLMHEFGHVLEHWLDLPVNEDAIEAACDAYVSHT